MIRYFVSYTFFHVGNIGFGNGIIDFRELQTDEDISDLQCKLSPPGTGMNSLTLLNFREIVSPRTINQDKIPQDCPTVKHVDGSPLTPENTICVYCRRMVADAAIYYETRCPYCDKRLRFHVSPEGQVLVVIGIDDNEQAIELKVDK